MPSTHPSLAVDWDEFDAEAEVDFDGRDLRVTDDHVESSPPPSGGRGGRQAQPRAPRSQGAGDFDDEEFEFAGTDTPSSTGRGRRGSASSSSSSGGASSDGASSDGASSSSRSAGRSASRQSGGTDSAPNAFALEYGMVAFCIVYVLVFLWGRGVNESIARAWLAEYQGFFEDQFYAVGMSAAAAAGEGGGHDAAEASPSPAMEKESMHQWRLFASGRRNCKGAMAQLDLIKRHDALSYAYGLVYGENEDLVNLDVVLDDDVLGPFIFAVVPAKRCSAYLAERADLKDFTKRVPLEMLPSSMIVLTDCREMIPVLLQDKVAKALDKYQDLFVSMHLTDQNAVTRLGKSITGKKTIQFQLRVPAVGDMSRLGKLLEMCLFLVDVAAQQCKLSKQAMLKATTARKKIERGEQMLEHQRRLERAAARKQEEAKKKKQRYGAMTPEQRRRQDEKDEKEKAKKRGGPRVKVMRM